MSVPATGPRHVRLRAPRGVAVAAGNTADGGSSPAVRRIPRPLTTRRKLSICGYRRTGAKYAAPRLANAGKSQTRGLISGIIR